MKKLPIAISILIFFCGCNSAKKPAPTFATKEISKVITEMSNLMIHDITSPPLAARFFGYTCLAGYEIVVQNDKEYKSLRGVVNGYPEIAKPDSIKGYNTQLASVLAMMETAQKMQPSGKLMAAFEMKFLDSCRTIGFDEETIIQSQKYAQWISKKILPFAKSDGYNKISNLPRYTPLQTEGRWYPTPPAYLPAVEPYFKTIRPFFLDSSNEFMMPPPIVFSKEKNSAFYKMMFANYQQGADSLKEENRQIGLYWDCNPFAVQDDGHLLVGLKKISPGAHWMGITGIACGNSNKSFEEAMFIHTLVAMGLMDSFIACWDEKYRSNRIRPETAIHQLIDTKWKPLLQTPPFPEYLSGHSCVSATSATILSHYIGDNIPFTDTVEVRFGLPTRNFKSFQQAAEEAAISRFYGGIHFMDAINNGMVQGKNVGDLLIKKVGK